MNQDLSVFFCGVLFQHCGSLSMLNLTEDAQALRLIPSWPNRSDCRLMRGRCVLLDLDRRVTKNLLLQPQHLCWNGISLVAQENLRFYPFQINPTHYFLQTFHTSV